jgi:hypothetical protein
MQSINTGIEMENQGCAAEYAGARQVLFSVSVSISNLPSAGTTANTGNRSGAGNNRMAAVENVQLVFSAVVNVPEQAGQTVTAMMASNASFPATVYPQAYQAYPATAGQGLEIAASFEPQDVAGTYAWQAFVPMQAMLPGSMALQGYAAAEGASRIATMAALQEGAWANQNGTAAKPDEALHTWNERRKTVMLKVAQADATPE